MRRRNHLHKIALCCGVPATLISTGMLLFMLILPALMAADVTDPRWLILTGGLFALVVFSFRLFVWGYAGSGQGAADEGGSIHGQSHGRSTSASLDWLRFLKYLLIIYGLGSGMWFVVGAFQPATSIK